MSTIKRMILGVPGAVAVTVGLGLVMTGLIQVDYLPAQEKPEQLSFVINETIEDLPPRRELEPPEREDVTVPPPPPVLETTPSTLPPSDSFIIDTLPPPPPTPTPDIGPVTFVVSDKDASPIVRMLPTMPPRFSEGNHSGFCTVRFDVSPSGAPYNVVATFCTASILKRATVKSVLKWKFNPKIVDGQPTSMRGVENRVTFNLLDENGRPLPEPQI